MAGCRGNAEEIYRAVARERKHIQLEESSMATATVTPDQNAVMAEIFIPALPARIFQAISDPRPAPQMVGAIGPVSRR
jgi:hypothetical protein